MCPHVKTYGMCPQQHIPHGLSMYCPSGKHPPLTIIGKFAILGQHYFIQKANNLSPGAHMASYGWIICIPLNLLPQVNVMKARILPKA